LLGAWIAALLLATMLIGASGSASAVKLGRAPAASAGRLGRPAAPMVVLYDQYDNQADFDVASQQFEAEFSVYDSLAADDFVVPGGQNWTVQQVDVDGEYNGGPADSFHVHFYSNAAGNLPGSLVGDALASSYAGSGGDAVITLSSPVTLSAGTYWVSVQARQSYGSAGQWFWQNRTVTSNTASAWENPHDGFGTGCTTWGRKLTCLPPQIGPDETFRLSGTIVPPTTPPPPPLPPPPPPPPPAVSCLVPRVIGLTLGRARTRIRARHCSVGRIRRARSRRAGRVIGQSPRGGTVRRRGYPVRLVVGRR